MGDGPRALPDWLEERLATAPREPGCYLMRDRVNDVVYVGKANNLRARLGQYFAPNPGDTRFFIGLLDRVLGSIELIVTPSPKEALLLENELIKRHQPRFNVKLKDDKNFLNIRIGRSHPWPRLEVTRRTKHADGDVFGPYESATAIRNTLRVVNRYFQLRTCRDTEFDNRTRPCLEHQIGRCPAPCVLDVSREQYEESLEEVRLLLRGRSRALVKRLAGKMQAASEALEFELAARYRDQIGAIERSLVKQTVRLQTGDDIDAVGLYREGATVAIQVLRLRGGAIVGTRGYLLKDQPLPNPEIVEDFLAAYYDGTRPIPDRVLAPVQIADTDAWSELFSEARGKKVRVYAPQRGDMRRILEMATQNAQKTFESRQKKAQDALATLEGLQKRLGLRELPARIECYDISNIQGTDAVGSQVVAIDGELAPKAYRHFTIRGFQTPNDFEMMREVLTRRVARGRKDGTLPDLIVVDGGKGQLRIAEEVLRELGADGEIELAGLAKSRVLDGQGHVKRQSHAAPASEATERSEERVFRPGRVNHVPLRAHSNELHLLVRLRDEAHRVAITHHKKKRRKRTLRSELGTIPGVGPSRQRALLTHFGSLAGVRAATLEELAACPGISATLAERVHAAVAGGAATGGEAPADH